MPHLDVGGSHPFPSERFHVARNPPEFGEVCLVERTVVCTHEVLPGVGHEHSTGGKLPGKIRNHHKRDMKGSRDLGCMERTGATEPDHDEIAWIVAPFDGHLTHCQ